MRFPWSARTEGAATGFAVGGPEITSSEAHPDNKNDVFNPTVHDGIASGSDEDKPSEDAQHGVQAVEAVTLVWSKTQLILAYAL
jgi:hypothetical protein